MIKNDMKSQNYDGPLLTSTSHYRPSLRRQTALHYETFASVVSGNSDVGGGRGGGSGDIKVVALNEKLLFVC